MVSDRIRIYSLESVLNLNKEYNGNKQWTPSVYKSLSILSRRFHNTEK